MQNNKGFTLIELMIVVTIVAILSAIAYPAYTSSVRKAGRTEAQGMLSLAAANMEKRKAQTLSYSGAAAGTDFPTKSPETGTAKFTLDFAEAVTDGTFVIRATSTDAQDGNSASKEIMMINQQGQRCIATDPSGDKCTFGTDPSW